MASDVQQTYYEWKNEQEDSQGPSISQMMDHGSISFGRFAFESLSWEKRSVFAHNERLAELENFKSPGLVAKKKAYFEEYYKKIRALKAAQNQQIELSLDYGADGSISSQTGDEDEPPLPKSISEAPLEDLAKHEGNEAFEDEFAGPGLAEDAMGKETIEPHKNRYEVKKEENYNKSVQAQICETEYLVHRLSTGSLEEVNRSENNHGVKWSYNKDTNLKMTPNLTPLVCLTDPAVLNAVEADFVPLDNPILEKNKLTVHKPKEDFTPVLMSKKQATPARHFSMSVNKSLPEKIKSTLGSKQLHTVVDKADINISLSKNTSSKARSCNKSTFVASYQLPIEVQNKAVIPRLSPLSKERKGAIPNVASKLVPGSHSEVTNRSSSRKFNPKGKLKVQGESKETTTQNTIKNRALQSKSAGHEEFKRNLGYYCSSVEGRTATELMKRSINIPCRNTHDRNRVVSYQTGSLSVGDKSKKANASTTRNYEGKSSNITTVSHSGNSKVDTIKKQMTTVEKHERPNGVCKSLIGGLLLDGKKSRKENPRWR